MILLSCLSGILLGSLLYLGYRFWKLDQSYDELLKRYIIDMETSKKAAEALYKSFQREKEKQNKWN